MLIFRAIKLLKAATQDDEIYFNKINITFF